MEEETITIKDIIGKLQLVKTRYKKELNIIEEYIYKLDRKTWKEVADDIEQRNFEQETKYLIDEVLEYLYKIIN